MLLVALTSRIAGWLGPATDLYSRWYGMRRLLLYGENPYGPGVTAALAAHMPFLAAGVEPAVPRDALATAFGFLYPLPGVLFLAPLALLPYEAALTAWMVAVLILLPVSALLTVDTVVAGPRAPADLPGAPLVRRLSLPLGLLFVPCLANLVHGQLAPAVVFAVALALWLSRRPAGRGATRWARWLSLPFLGGAVFAAGASIKPHLVLLLAPLWLGWALLRWRRGGSEGAAAAGFAAGALAATVLLTALATLLVPSWPLDFLRAAGAYVSLTRVDYEDVTNAILPGGPAVWRLAEAALPAPVSWIVAGGAAAALVGWAVAGWREAAPEAADSGGVVARGVGRALLVTALVVPPAWETNAALLLVPLALQVGRLAGRPRLAVAMAATSIVLSLVDLPLYATQPWRNAPLLILAYTLLPGIFALAARWPAPRLQHRTTKQREAREAPSAGTSVLRGRA